MIKTIKKITTLCIGLFSLHTFANDLNAETEVLSALKKTAQLSDEEINLLNITSDIPTKTLAIKVALTRVLINTGLYSSENNAAKYVNSLDIESAQELLNFLKISNASRATGSTIPTSPD